MRKALQITVLALALCVSAYAGDMQCGSPVPPQDATCVQAPTTTDGEIPNPLLQVVLNALTSLSPLA